MEFAVHLDEFFHDPITVLADARAPSFDLNRSPSIGYRTIVLFSSTDRLRVGLP